jgi:hypothetical protein
MADLAVGKVIKMACMRAGPCKYMLPKNETIMVSAETLKLLAPTMQGVPVVLDHPAEKITDENIAALPVVGRVADMHYNEDDQNWYAHFVVDDDQAVKLLQDGWGVSTAWIPTKWGQGGTFNNIPFDRELLEGRYEHLAIVKNPRYEMASNPIFMNSDDQALQKPDSKDIIKTDKSFGSVSMLGKLFRKKSSKEEIMINAAENEEIMVEINGKEMSLKDAIELAAKAETPAERIVNGDDMVDVDGEKVSINDLVEAYKASKVKKNEDESSEEKEETEEKEDKEETKENSKSAEEIAAEAAANVQTNANFQSLDQAYKSGSMDDPSACLSLHEKMELGRSRYGSK